MSNQHPENIFNYQPTNLDPSEVQVEISNSKNAIILNAGFLAIASTLEAFEIAPELLDAINRSDMPNIIQYGGLGALIGGASYMAISSIRSYGKRWSQARYNQKLINIAKENGL